VAAVSAAVPGRLVHVVAYAGKALRGLPTHITWTTRLRANAALFTPAPPRTGKRGRTRLRGDRLPSLQSLAASTPFSPTTVARYGSTTTVATAVIRCLWYGAFGAADGVGGAPTSMPSAWTAAASPKPR